MRVQQAGLRSQMIPYGRLLPKSESPIRHFHRLVYDALASRRAESSVLTAGRPLVPSQQPGFLVASPDPTALRRSGSQLMSTPSDPSNEPARIDRGKLLKRSAGIALGTSLYSFGDPLTVLAAQMKPKALKPDGDLAYFNWAQYIDQKLLRGFEKEYKVKVNESNFTNMENMLAKLRAGVKYDVAFPEAQTAAQLVKANFLAPLDHANLTNWSQVNSAFHNPWYDAGAKYTVPYAIWTTGIAWRTDKVHGHDGLVERPLQPPRGGQAHVPARRLPRGHRHGPAGDRHQERQLHGRAARSASPRTRS